MIPILAREKKKLSLLQAWYVVPRSVGGVAARGGLGERLALLGAGGSSRGELGGGLIPSRVGGVPVGELALHSHLQKLNTRGRVVVFLDVLTIATQNTCISSSLGGNSVRTVYSLSVTVTQANERKYKRTRV